MGGSVSIVIRRSSGAIQKLRMWTNSVPVFFVHPKMMIEDSSFIGRLIASRDENNHAINSTLNNIDETYLNWDKEYCSPGSALAPYDYGLIVIDFKEMVIYDMQDYCTMNEIFCSSIRRDSNSLDADLSDDLSYSYVLKGFCESGMLNSLWLFNKKGDFEEVEIPAENIKFDELTLLMLGEHSSERNAVCAKVGVDDGYIPSGFSITSPFKINKYEKTCSNLVVLREALAGVGFEFSDYELLQWSLYHDDCMEREQKVIAMNLTS